MRYYVKKKGKDEITGPITVEEILARVKACRLDRWDKVVAENGRTPEQIAEQTDLQWEQVSDVIAAAHKTQIVVPVSGLTFDDERRQLIVARRAAANKMMVHGALWCIGGIVVTAVTFSMASANATGGSFVVAWGAILFGFIQFLKGLTAR